MKRYKVGILGATGMVGRRFVALTENHPWFEPVVLAASPRSAGKCYGDAVSARLSSLPSFPAATGDMIVKDAVADMKEIVKSVDFVFCAVDMNKDEIKKLEEAYAGLECPVISNTGACRMIPDVPMVIPEINADHLNIIPSQRKRLGTRRGFIAVKANCSVQSYVPALHPLKNEFGLTEALVCTYQAVSGAGMTLDLWPEMVDNVIPYIGGEEDKSETEPGKIWGRIEGEAIKNAREPSITAQCVRVPVSDGHLAAVFMRFERKPSRDEIIARWESYTGRAQELGLPSAPKKFLHYFTEDDRPQTKRDRMLENGMAVAVGRLRRDTQYDYKFICLSHNTLRGAAGGSVLLAELLCAEGWI